MKKVSLKIIFLGLASILMVLGLVACSNTTQQEDEISVSTEPSPTFEAIAINEYVETADTALGARFSMDVERFCNRLMECIPGTTYNVSDWLIDDSTISDGKHTYKTYD